MEATAAGVAAARDASLPVSSSSQPSMKQWRAVTEQSGRNSTIEELEHSNFGNSDERLIYEQRLHSVVKQREELQQMEMELRAQLIARTEIIDMQNTFDAQIKEHVNTKAMLQEQVRDREQKLFDLRRKYDDLERELQLTRLDSAAVWAKDDLLREQNQEIQSYMRERESCEAERVKHIKQIHELQEHIQEKERQFAELQEQNRIALESLGFKDEQLREAQAWISRVQEMDAFQSSTNHSLHAELRERNEQYSHLWVAFQRQYGEMERMHLHLQQLQIELAEAKEKNGDTSPKDVSLNNGSSQANESAENASTENDQMHGGVPLIGMTSYLGPGQVHPFVMHQHGFPPQYHHSVPIISGLQQWQNQQAVTEGLEMSSHDQPASESVNGQINRPEFLNVNNISQSVEPNNNNNNNNNNDVQIDGGAHFHDALRLNTPEHSNENNNANHMGNSGLEAAQGLTNEVPSSNYPLQSEVPKDDANANANANASSGTVSPPPPPSSGQESSPPGAVEIPLLDERSLLACVVRTIPPGSAGRIRISSTLPNRLAKMLAPLHWHDYKKKYGKLDEFVGSHPELFVIDGDHIELREGAQGIITATAAVAKVAAAAATSSRSSSVLPPSVAVTPMAQTYRLKKSLPNETAAMLHNNGGGSVVSNVKIMSKGRDHVEQNGGFPTRKPQQQQQQQGRARR